MKKIIWLYLCACLVLILSCVFSLILGPAKFSLKELIAALLNPHNTSSASLIIWQIRIPRLILGLLVGAGLSVCGATLQALLRNPLAEPYTLGISSGAALGVALAFALNLAGISLPLFAFLGAVLSIVIVYNVASWKKFTNSTLILAGVILNSFFSSLVLLLFGLLKSSKIQNTIIWLMGDLSSFSQSQLKLVAAFIILGISLLIFLGRDINVLTLGDEKAMHLGIDVELMKKIIFVLASLVTGACVAVSGIIGFIGLLIPHFIRQFSGPEHRVLLPLSAIVGAAFLVICDSLSRTLIAPLELPVGVVTGICGGFFFLLLITKAKKWEIF